MHINADKPGDSYYFFRLYGPGVITTHLPAQEVILLILKPELIQHGIEVEQKII
jgi:hypothetical protein